MEGPRSRNARGVRVLGPAGALFLAIRHAGSVDLYRQAAWLISNYNTTNVQATQATLWNLFQNPGSNWTPDAALLAQAQAPHPGFDFSDFYVVTDVNAGGVNDASNSGTGDTARNRGGSMMSAMESKQNAIAFQNGDGILLSDGILFRLHRHRFPEWRGHGAIGGGDGWRLFS